LAVSGPGPWPEVRVPPVTVARGPWHVAQLDPGISVHDDFSGSGERHPRHCDECRGQVFHGGTHGRVPQLQCLFARVGEQVFDFVDGKVCLGVLVAEEHPVPGASRPTVGNRERNLQRRQPREEVRSRLQRRSVWNGGKVGRPGSERRRWRRNRCDGKSRGRSWGGLGSRFRAGEKLDAEECDHDHGDCRNCNTNDVVHDQVPQGRNRCRPPGIPAAGRRGAEGLGATRSESSRVSPRAQPPGSPGLPGRSWS
jgi:hypothetical protein